MHSAALAQQFCSFVGGAHQQNHTEHARKQLLIIKFSMQWISPPKRQFVFLSLKLFFGGWHLCKCYSLLIIVYHTLSVGDIRNAIHCSLYNGNKYLGNVRKSASRACNSAPTMNSISMWKMWCDVTKYLVP